MKQLVSQLKKFVAKAFRKSIKIRASKRMEWIEITKKVQGVVKESKIKEG